MAAIAPIVQQATYTMSDPADLINVAIEQLILHRFRHLVPPCSSHSHHLSVKR